jgi:hypothetical protein
MAKEYNPKGNASQNDTELLFHPKEQSSRKHTTEAGEDAGSGGWRVGRDLLYTVGGNVN